MFKLVVRVALVASVLTPLAAVAQELIPSAPQRAQTSETAGRQNAPGQFDFYVLALSWSPSFCAAATERPSARGPGAECSARPYAFVVHGLWPQYDAGFPEYCQMPSPRLDRGIVSSMLDLMPAPHLIFSEWDRHGTCSGLAPHAYFEAVRRARAAIKIPSDYVDLDAPLNIAPAAVADAFIKANPGLALSDIAIGCNGTRLTEVRLCLAKDLSKAVEFHDCAEIAKRSCRRDQVVMPPVRGNG